MVHFTVIKTPEENVSDCPPERVVPPVGTWAGQFHSFVTVTCASPGFCGLGIPARHG